MRGLLLFILIVIPFFPALAQGPDDPCTLKHKEFCSPGLWEGNEKLGKDGLNMRGHYFDRADGDFALCDILEEGQRLGENYSILKCLNYNYAETDETCDDRYEPGTYTDKTCLMKDDVHGIFLGETKFYLLHRYTEYQPQKSPKFATIAMTETKSLPCLLSKWNEIDQTITTYKDMRNDFICDIGFGYYHFYHKTLDQ